MTLAEIMEDIVDHKLYMEQGFALVCHVLYDDDVDDPSFIALCNLFSLYDAVKYGSDAQPDRDWENTEYITKVYGSVSDN